MWHFNSDGEASDEDELVDTDYLSSTSAGESTGSGSEQTTMPSSERAARKLRSRKRGWRVIQDIFPGLRSLLFLGMWDSHQERWFGASIVLSHSATRMFSIQVLLSYGADVSLRGDYRSALNVAQMRGWEDIVKILVIAGAAT